MKENAQPYLSLVVSEYLQVETTERMDWLELSPDVNAIEHAWDISQRPNLRFSTKPTSLGISRADLAVSLVVVQ